MILTAALNLRWHKACKKVSFIIYKMVPLEAEEWPCSAELTYATGLMVELCWREAHGDITTPEAGLAMTINQGTQIMHQKHWFKSSKNGLKSFLRISLLFVITCVQGDYYMTAIFFGDTFRKVIIYPAAKEMQRTFTSNGSNYDGVFVPENWMEKFIKWIQFFIIHF